jgi:DUF1365 family protein
MTRRSGLLRGHLMHARSDEHARRSFRYPVYIASLDLDELPALDRELMLFSHGGRNLFGFHDADYEAGAHGVPAALAGMMAANQLPMPHTTRLITNLRVAGYVFNPVSFFLNYDAAGALGSVIAEVNNTYGGRRRYVLGPDQRIEAERVEPGRPASTGTRARRVGFRHIRELFVSPFLHGPASYEFWFDAPLDGDRLAITMHVTRPTGERIFVAQLAGTRQPLSDRALLAAALRYPLMTAQVIGRIHLQGLKLRLAGVPFVGPGPDHRPRPTAPSIRSHTSGGAAPGSPREGQPSSNVPATPGMGGLK